MDISKNRPISFNKDNRLSLEPIPHLREGMPNVLMIKFGETVHYVEVQRVQGG